MNKTEIMNAVTRTTHKVGFQLKKHSPEILMVASSIGVIVGTVAACKATTKLNGIIDQAKEHIDTIHDVVESEAFGDEYSIEDSKKDLAIVYAQTGFKVAKLYAPAVTITTLSIMGFFASNNILRQRYLATAAAYAVVDKSFKEYRGRVVDRFGQQVDKELRYGFKAQEIEETIIDEKGKEKTVKKTVNMMESTPKDENDFRRIFDESNTNWLKDADRNFYFLKAQQQYANDLLVSRGYVFLNEVYEMLGFDSTKPGQIVGWVYDPENAEVDSYIDFGFIDMFDPAKRSFANGWERSVILDFNVDGPILDRAFK